MQATDNKDYVAKQTQLEEDYVKSIFQSTFGTKAEYP